MESKFTWTQEYRRTWEENFSDDKSKVPEQRHTTYNGRKTLIRHVLLAIDVSSSIEKGDYVPTVRQHVAESLGKFVDDFKKQNPLSIMSFISYRETLVSYTKQFSSRSLLGSFGSGSFSFLNCLKSVISILKKSKFSRECLLITASIGTKDSSGYEEIIQLIKKHNIKVNIISICGDVTIFRRISACSGGKFVVPLNMGCFLVTLEEFSFPLPLVESKTCLVRLGFPQTRSSPGICVCHLDVIPEPLVCPNCGAFICSLPAQCYICETQLVSSLDVIRTARFLFSSLDLESGNGVCASCGNDAAKACPKCKTVYCDPCAAYMEEDLFFCPFCSKD